MIQIFHIRFKATKQTCFHKLNSLQRLSYSSSSLFSKHKTKLRTLQTLTMHMLHTDSIEESDAVVKLCLMQQMTRMQREKAHEQHMAAQQQINGQKMEAQKKAEPKPQPSPTVSVTAESIQITVDPNSADATASKAPKKDTKDRKQCCLKCCQRMWSIFGFGFIMSLIWYLLAVIAILLMITYRPGKRIISLIPIVNHPFDKSWQKLAKNKKESCLCFTYLGCVIWFPFGLFLSLLHLLLAIIWCPFALFGVPFASFHLQFICVALYPQNKTLIDKRSRTCLCCCSACA